MSEELGLIHSIYLSHEGEGVNVGTPQIFIRFQGCNIGCKNCDSKETWTWKKGASFSLKEILTKIQQINKYQDSYNSYLSHRPHISITGGDPLHLRHSPFVEKLCRLLKKNDYFINLEASGNIIHKDIFSLVDLLSFDFKTPSTGVKTNIQHILKLIDCPPKQFQIKSVIETKKDYYYVLSAWQSINDFFLKQKKRLPSFDWCLTPAFNPKDSKENFTHRLRWLLEINRQTSFFKVIAQQHKWAYEVHSLNI